MLIFAVSNGTSSTSISCRVQEIWSHKIITMSTTTKHSLLQGLTTPNVMGMSPCLNMFYKPQSLLCPMVQIPCPSRKGFRKYSHTNLPICTKITKHGRFHWLTAPYLMGCHNTFTHAYKLQSLLHPTVQAPCP